MADILIIEDDQVFGELLAMHLEDRGHRPALVPQSMRHVRSWRIRSQTPSCWTSNCRMVWVDLLHDIKARFPITPVIMITGVSDNTLAIRAMQLGAYDFICKPMDEIELDTTLAMHCAATVCPARFPPSLDLMIIASTSTRSLVKARDSRGLQDHRCRCQARCPGADYR